MGIDERGRGEDLEVRQIDKFVMNMAYDLLSALLEGHFLGIIRLQTEARRNFPKF
jgi:hypothetical protein